MNRTIPLFVIGLVLGGGIGFTIAAGNGITLDGHDHTDASAHGQTGHEMNDSSGNSHAGHDMPLVLPVSATAPRVSLKVAKDPSSGWNVHIEPQYFNFAPTNASLDHVAGEGHAHLYVNGVKFARAYGEWMHVPLLPDGENEIMVTLNSNDHKPLVVGETPVAASVTVDAP